MSLEDEVIEVCRQAIGKSYERRPLQEEAIKKIIKWLENGAEKPFILRLPTGYGKTLIGLAPALYQAAREDWRYFGGLLYVLPMRALCSQVADKSREYLQRLLTDKGRSFIVREFHGAVPFSERFSGDVIVATYDVFVYAYARKLGAMLDYPAGTMATSMIVLDEAQMLQDEQFYSYTLLQKVLEALRESGVPILLMTATLPRRIKEVLFPDMELEEFSPSSGELARERFKGIVKEVRYEENSLIDVGIVKDYIEKYREMTGENPRTIFIVFNTVKRLLEVWKKFMEEGELVRQYRIECLHGKQKNIERRVKVQMLEKICGDPSKRDPDALGEHEGIILLATQVVEAGIDLSCDLMLTELAPLDSIVQRTGRCARFREENGLLVITEIENPEPYPEQLVDLSRNIIKGESSRDLTTALVDYQSVSNLIDKAYEGWMPREEKEVENLLYYVSYFEKSLGPLNGDLETAKELRFRLDDYVEIVFPQSSAELRYYVAEKVGEESGWRKNRWKLKVREGLCQSNVMDMLEKACSFQDDQCVVLIEGETVFDGVAENKTVEEWINDNSVSISLNLGERDEKRIKEAVTWQFGDKNWIFALLEVPRGVVRGWDESAAIIKPIKVEKQSRLPRGLARIYLGRPEFYERDVGFSRGGA